MKQNKKNIGGNASYHFALSLNNNGGKAALIANWDDTANTPLVAVKGRVVGYRLMFSFLLLLNSML